MSLATERRYTVGRVREGLATRFPFLRLNYKRQLFLLLLPYLIGLFGLVLLPALLSVPFAFTDFDALSPPEWIGLGNFEEMAADTFFWNGLGVSLFFIATAVPLRVLGALMMAFLLHRPGRGHGTYRTIVYLPTIVPDVAYALLWLYIFNPLFGPLNWVLTLFGYPTTGWLLMPQLAPWAIVLMMLWPIGEGFVLMLAAMQEIPREVEECAIVDGATGRQRFFQITLPLLAPAILLLAFRDTVLSFQLTFVPGLVTTNTGPYYATQFLPIYIYENAAEHQKFGYAAAMTWVMYIVTAAVIALQIIIARRWRRSLHD